MRYGLSEQTIELIHAVLRKYPEVEKAVLYGSRAKGNFRQGSDIDLTLQGSGMTLTLLHAIENDLDELLLPYKIDLSVFEQITDQDVIEHIRRVGGVFYERVA